MQEKSKAQNEEEIHLFNRFVEASRIQVKSDSINKLNPPNPDILCELIDGTMLAVEITEITDRGLSKSESDIASLANYLDEYLTNNPIPELSDAYVAINFADDLTLQQRKKVVQPLFELLQSLPANHIGKIDVKQSEVSNVITHLEIMRLNLVGPVFGVASATWIADATMNTLMNKVN